MRKRIVLLVALCATIMSLVACDNTKTTNTEVTGTPAAQEEVKSDKEDKTPETDATVEPTTEPTVEATVTLTETSAVPTKVEVSWEESGMSYELFENPDGTVAVIVTNNSDTIYYCHDALTNGMAFRGFTTEANNKWYIGFLSVDEAEKFTTNLDNNATCVPQTGNRLTTEIACNVTNERTTDTIKVIEFETDDLAKHFTNCTNLNTTASEYVEVLYSMSDLVQYTGACIVYDENNEIITIQETKVKEIFGENLETYKFAGATNLPEEIEYSKIAMVMQYTWADGIFE